MKTYNVIQTSSTHVRTHVTSKYNWKRHIASLAKESTYSNETYNCVLIQGLKLESRKRNKLLIIWIQLDAKRTNVLEQELISARNPER